MSIDGADGATAVTAAQDVTAVMGTRDDERTRGPGSTGVIGLVAALLGFFMLSLDSTAVNVALPGIERDLGGSTAGLQWVIDAYTLMFAALLISAGAVSDRAGAKRLYATGLAAFLASSAACGLAPHARVPGRLAGGPGQRRRCHAAGLARAGPAGVR